MKEASLAVAKGERATLATDNCKKAKRATQPSLSVEKGKSTKRARKGQSESFENPSRSKVPDFERNWLLGLDSNQQPSG